MDYKGIYTGWLALIKHQTTDIHKERANECSKCDEAKNSIIEVLLPDLSDTKSVNGLICGLCSCPLQAKIRTEGEKCDKWKR